MSFLPLVKGLVGLKQGRIYGRTGIGIMFFLIKYFKASVSIYLSWMSPGKSMGLLEVTAPPMHHVTISISLTYDMDLWLSDLSVHISACCTRSGAVLV